METHWAWMTWFPSAWQENKFNSGLFWWSLSYSLTPPSFISLQLSGVVYRSCLYFFPFPLFFIPLKYASCLYQTNWCCFCKSHQKSTSNLLSQWFILTLHFRWSFCGIWKFLPWNSLHPGFLNTIPSLIWYAHLVTQLCPILCDLMDCSPLGFSVHGFFKQEYWSWLHFLLQGTFPTEGSNPSLLCLLHCRWSLYPLSHWGSSLLDEKEESEKADLRLKIQKTKIMASGPITSWHIDG